MAKLTIGQKVSIAFNPQKTDPRVKGQNEEWTDHKGRVRPPAPGTGNYQTVAQTGTILEITEKADGIFYMVGVELGANPGDSVRKRLIAEDKLTAL